MATRTRQAGGTGTKKLTVGEGALAGAAIAAGGLAHAGLTLAALIFLWVLVVGI